MKRASEILKIQQNAIRRAMEEKIEESAKIGSGEHRAVGNECPEWLRSELIYNGFTVKYDDKTTVTMISW